MHTESENYDFLMYTLHAGQSVPSLYTQYYRTAVLGDTPELKVNELNVKRLGPV